MFRGLFVLRVLLGSFLVLVVACGGAAAPTAAPATPTEAPPPPATTAPPSADGGAAADGQSIFTGSGGCGACHAIDGITAGQVGPDLTHIGTDAASRKPGTSAEDYIRESITDPEVFVPEGVDRAIPGLMTSALTSNLSGDQVDALVEFMLAQK